MFDRFLNKNKTSEIELPELADHLNELSPSTPRETLGLVVCQLALQARQQGNYGVGALLCHRGKIVFRAENAVFYPARDSAAHAEMRLLDQWEQQGRQVADGDIEELSLICSLEPCPMCLSRILMAGITRIYYLAEDQQGGMLKRARHLPPAFKNLLQRCDYGPLLVDDAYVKMAEQLAQHGLNELRAKLLS